MESVSLRARNASGDTQIFLHPMDTEIAHPFPALSSDRDRSFHRMGVGWDSYRRISKLMKIPIGGGVPQLWPTPRVPVARAGDQRNDPLFVRLPGCCHSADFENGGAVRVIASPDRSKGENGYFWPLMLPREAGHSFQALISSH